MNIHTLSALSILVFVGCAPFDKKHVTQLQSDSTQSAQPEISPALCSEILNYSCIHSPKKSGLKFLFVADRQKCELSFKATTDCLLNIKSTADASVDAQGVVRDRETGEAGMIVEISRVKNISNNRISADIAIFIGPVNASHQRLLLEKQIDGSWKVVSSEVLTIS